MTSPSRFTKKRIFLIILTLTLTLLGSFGLPHQYKPLPYGLSYKSDVCSVPENDIKFLHDLTWYKGDVQHKEQEIFDSVFALIDRADRYILIDMFLFNDQTGKSTRSFRNLSGELAAHLINKKRSSPETVIDVITDPINIVYGGSHSPIIDRLMQAGINVIVTNLSKLRDSNRFYSPVWRLFFQWLGNSDKGGFFPHPFSADEKGVSLRSYLSLLNFKANHRKIILTDADSTFSAIVASANPHDASADHSNTAFAIKGKVCKELYDCESAVARISGGTLGRLPSLSFVADSITSGCNVRFFTEGAIRDALVRRVSSTDSNDTISVAVFYLSDRKVISSLKNAVRRGVTTGIILDPNTNAFGYKKNGIPNLPVAAELVEEGCDVSFYNSIYEQFHTKMICIRYASDSIWAMTGSANYTRRNIGDLNLELDCAVSGKRSAAPARQILAYCDRLFKQTDTAVTLTTPFSPDKKSGFFSRCKYRFFEASGFSSF